MPHLINFALFVIAMVESAKSRRDFWKWYRAWSEREEDGRDSRLY